MHFQFCCCVKMNCKLYNGLWKNGFQHHSIFVTLVTVRKCDKASALKCLSSLQMFTFFYNVHFSFDKLKSSSQSSMQGGHEKMDLALLWIYYKVFDDMRSKAESKNSSHPSRKESPVALLHIFPSFVSPPPQLFFNWSDFIKLPNLYTVCCVF